jgi:hypothetical protein
MLTLDDSALEALTKKGAKIVVKNSPAPVVETPSELTQILKTMVSILNRPVERNVTPSQPAPNVTVMPPSVSVSPNVVVERNNTRFRVAVTAWALPPGSPPGSQLRIQELIIEPIE